MIVIDAGMARDISKFQSTEEMRYYLNGFYVQPRPKGGVFIVATDGHRMGIFHDPNGICTKPAIIRLPKDFLKQCKTKNADLVVLVEGTTARLVYSRRPDQYGAITENDIVAAAFSVVVDGTFPDWQRILPRETDNPSPAAFNSRYLADFGSLSPDRAGAVKLFGEDERSPAWVRVCGMENFVGVLMPVRWGDATCKPDWLDFKPAEEMAAAAE